MVARATPKAETRGGKQSGPKATGNSLQEPGRLTACKKTTSGHFVLDGRTPAPTIRPRRKVGLAATSLRRKKHVSSLSMWFAASSSKLSPTQRIPPRLLQRPVISMLRALFAFTLFSVTPCHAEWETSANLTQPFSNISRPRNAATIQIVFSSALQLLRLHRVRYFLVLPLIFAARIHCGLITCRTAPPRSTLCRGRCCKFPSGMFPMLGRPRGRAPALARNPASWSGRHLQFVRPKQHRRAIEGRTHRHRLR